MEADPAVAGGGSDLKSIAEKKKEEGNELLKACRYGLAAEKYTEAIAISPSAIYYSNRAQALIKLESYGLAIEDANEAIRLDEKYIKAYYRRGSANFALGKLNDARKDFMAVLKVQPKEPDAKAKVNAIDKALKEKKLIEALSRGDEDSGRSSESTIDVDSITVESGYVGPKLEGHITTEIVKEIVSHFREQKTLHRKYVLKMLIEAKSMFGSLPSLLRIPLPTVQASADETGTAASSTTAPADDSEAAESPESVSAAVQLGHFTVCGDTHGQFYDLLNIFEIGGFPSETNPYLFNGDFVDRGSFSFETVMTLIAIKLACPTALHMTRGNHETKNMNKIYGFEGEVLFKYDTVVMGLFSEVFNLLPLAAVIQDAVFVVHGGLSTMNEGEVSLSEIEALSRHSNREPPESGLMSDLLWSDPQFMPGRSLSKRGVGFSFGPDFTQRFLDHNGLKLLVRSHEVKHEGYVVEHNGKCVTIFSAPNYCDQMGNKGAFIRFEADMVPRYTQYEAVPHPNIPPMRYAGNLFGL